MTKIAIVGSGLSSTGVLAALKDKKHFQITQFCCAQDISPEKTKHRLYLHSLLGFEPLLHKSGLHLDDLEKELFNTYNRTISSQKFTAELLTSFRHGGLSNYWGGVSLPILPWEIDSFSSANIFLNASIYNNAINNLCLVGLPNFEDETRDLLRNDITFLPSKILSNSKENLPLNVAQIIDGYSHNKIYDAVVTVENKSGRAIVNTKLKKTYEFDYVLMTPGVNSSSILASELDLNIEPLRISMNDQRIGLFRYKLGSDFFKYYNFAHAFPSAFINLNNKYFYIQLYALRSLYPLRFYGINDIPHEGYMLAYLYSSFDESKSISLIINPDSLHYNYKNNEGSHAFPRKEMNEILRQIGLQNILPFIALSPGSSQHFSSSLSRYINSRGVNTNFCFKGSENIFFVDPSIFPHTPLCTIGLTAMTAAYSITHNLIKNSVIA